MSVSFTMIQISWYDPLNNGGCAIAGFEIWRDDANEDHLSKSNLKW